ncbi:MAG TPA: hypothetical protein VK453_28315 [Micromonosporaceae bacterium]|nr:hypothetical protein [Micromonosporaceae bacterium]
MFNHVRARPRALLMALLAAILALSVIPVGPAAAAPGADDEGGTPQLRASLDTVNRAFIDAQTKLDNSRKRQAELAERATTVDAEVTRLRAVTDEIVGAVYRSGGLRTASALLGSASPDTLLDKATTMNLLAVRSDRLLREMTRLQTEVRRNREAIDAEVASQQQQLDIMAKQKQQAEAALRAAGGGPVSSGVPATNSVTAPAVPRRADGSLPAQSCSVNDPTTNGCITPRTLNAMQQAKAAGFTRFVSCHRSGGSGEHPKGRACDFASDVGGFGGVAGGASRTYGNNLAAYFVANAKRLGVLYVIWFKQIWSPALGWHAYRRGNGDPSSDHTNHVHLSML